jgi:hypothetical protein
MNRSARGQNPVGARVLPAPIHFQRKARRLLLAAACLSLLGGVRTALADGAVVVLEETASGAASLAMTVATSTDLTSVDEELYLAAVSMEDFARVVSVDGLGLGWTRIGEQCSGRGNTGVSLWMAQGIVATSGPVSAQFASAPTSAVISVARYSGVKNFGPVGAVASANANGVQGTCTAGIDSATYSANVEAIADGAVIFSAVATLERSHTPGAGYAEIDEVSNGATGGARAGIATQHRTLTSAGLVAADGSLTTASTAKMVAILGSHSARGADRGHLDSRDELAQKPLSGEAGTGSSRSRRRPLEPNIRATTRAQRQHWAVALVYARTGLEVYWRRRRI